MMIFTYCAGFVFVVAGFIVDDFNSPQQHSAFSPLGMACYVLGALLFLVAIISMLRLRKQVV